MPPLPNPKHERFALELAKGVRSQEAFVAAGYKYDRTNAWRLKTNAQVVARVAEIQQRAAIRAEITLATITEDLLRVAAQGEALGGTAGLAVARAALMDVAKLNGLVVERSAQVQLKLEDMLGQLDRLAEP